MTQRRGPPSVRPDRNDWTPDEDARLLALRADGRKVGVIAVALDRSLGSITGRLSRLGVPAPGVIGRRSHAKAARRVPSLAELVPLASLGQGTDA